MEFAFNPALTLSGFGVGILVGLTGVGGGSLMTPLLVLAFGVKPITAVGTDLLYAAITKSGGSWVHHRHGNVDWRITARLAGGSLPAAGLTLMILAQFGTEQRSVSGLISSVLGVALLLTAASLIFRQRLLALARRRSASADFSQRHVAGLTLVVGAVIGVLVTITSVGAGALGVAALTFLYPNLATRQVVGSDIAHAVPLTFVAGLGHWWLGTVDVALLASLLLGSLPGIALGAHFVAKLPERALRGLLAAVLLLVGGKLILV
ncbi:MAG: sulfite exporter TauE/SafE family protein [Burkholderiaceae bacterium]|nr:sulfite exporter TauE/SafE family protein [Sulfuritalea sp.]MCF8175169.1 sulfite exporter TauE/SafE family protein [Burkholderiaceae bacterium]MCF8183899.1 sulfite exporter TauE/SafE family protein [Polynucleobacter sp.]